MNHRLKLRMTGAFAVLIAALSGCDGANEPKFELVPVRGNVTLNGQPLADAQVSFWFQGTSPKGYTGSGGKTDAQGNYELTTLSQKGTIVGKHKAVVSKMTMKDGSPLQVAEGMDEQQLIAEGKVVESIPPPFNDPTNTPVAFEVTKDKADGYDIKITK